MTAVQWRFAERVQKPCPLMPPGAEEYQCSHGRFYWRQVGWMRCLFREGVYDSISLRFVRRGTMRLLSPKTCLRFVTNGWLFKHEIDKANQMGRDRKMTQETAEIELRKLEHEVSGRLAMWRMYQ